MYNRLTKVLIATLQNLSRTFLLKKENQMSEKTVRMVLKEMGTHPVHSIGVGASVSDVAKLLAKHNVGALIVMNDETLAGIVSERDITKRLVAEGLDAFLTKVERIMTSEVISVTPHTNLKECEDLMKEKGIRHLPVMENGVVMAMISIRDLLVSTRKEQEEMADHLRGYMMQR